MIRKQRGKPSEDLRNDCIARGLRATALRCHHHAPEKYRANRACRTGRADARLSRTVASRRTGIRER